MVQTLVQARHTLGFWIVFAAAILWVASLTFLLVVSPSGTVVSSDQGAEAVSYWVTLLPTVLGILLVLLIPRRSPARLVVIHERRKFTITTFGLLFLAVLFPLASAVLPLQGEQYVLGKLLLLMILPGALLILLRGSIRIDFHKNAARWWAPLIVIALWTAVSQLAPRNPSFDLAGLDPVFVLTVALSTAVTAGIGEELFYRRWLQCRLEARLGAWPGIVVASAGFALMHFGSHGQGEFIEDVARAIVVQGSFGLFLGILWWRYRNLLANIVVHIFANGWAVAAALLAA